jgi:HEPN domain-containing protein
MLNGRRFLYVGFMCHQVIEKMLKAYYVFINNDNPPYIHNLSILAEKSGILELMTEEQKDFMDLLEPLNIEARYPKDKEKVMRSLSFESCKDILQKTKDLYQWIKKQLLTE